MCIDDVGVCVGGVCKKQCVGAYLIVPHNEAAVQNQPQLFMWNLNQRSQRVIIEYVNAYLKCFGAVSGQHQFRHSVPFQTQVIHTAALLANRQLRENPLRQ